MAHDGCNCYFLSWAIFCPFTPLTAWKMNISRKWKKCLEISTFYTSVPKIMVISYTIPDTWHVTHVIIIFHFGYSLPFYLPAAQKIKISKKWNKSLEISSFYKYAPKIMIRWCMALEMWCTADTQTDRKSET